VSATRKRGLFNIIITVYDATTTDQRSRSVVYGRTAVYTVYRRHPSYSTSYSVYSTRSDPLTRVRALLLKGSNGRGGKVEGMGGKGKERGVKGRESGTPILGRKLGWVGADRPVAGSKTG